MQKHPLLQFIESKIKEITPKEVVAGPVITISRDYGCPGYTLGMKLAEQLSTMRSMKDGVVEWKALNREILNQAAKEIHLSPEMVDRIIHHKPLGMFADLFGSFSDHYVPNDLEVKKAVAGIIQGMAVQGNIIIVGRAGAMITQDLPNTLHIHLYAPFKHRVTQVVKHEGLSEEEAKRTIQRVDQERVYIRNFFAGESADSSFFDATFNTANLSMETISEAIIAMAKSKGLIQ